MTYWRVARAVTRPYGAAHAYALRSVHTEGMQGQAVQR